MGTALDNHHTIFGEHPEAVGGAGVSDPRPAQRFPAPTEPGFV